MTKLGKDLPDQFNAVTGKVESNVAQVSLYPSGYKVGADLADGMTQGFVGSINFQKTIQDAIIDAANTKLDRHSPSKVFHEMGRDSALGYNTGWSNHANIEFPSVRGGFSAASFGGPGGGGFQVPVSIVFNLPGGVPTDPAHVAQLSESVRAASHNGVMQALEELCQH